MALNACEQSKPSGVAATAWSHLAAALLPAPGRQSATKRAIDLVGGLGGLVLCAPLLAAAAVAIKLDDGGPVLFRQQRVGASAQPFMVVKLRTMRVGADGGGLGLLAGRDDPRTTRTGSLLRRLGIDELPQLVNVLAGQMSLVGPRPTVASQVERYSPEQLRRLTVRPGIAGWAQVNGRNTICWTRRIELDLWYIDNWSHRLDLQIMLRALWTAASGTGVYGDDGLTQDFGPCPTPGGCRCALDATPDTSSDTSSARAASGGAAAAEVLGQRVLGQRVPGWRVPRQRVSRQQTPQPAFGDLPPLTPAESTGPADHVQPWPRVPGRRR